MSPLRLVTLAGDPEREADVAAAIGAHPGAELLFRCVDRMELLAAIRGGDLDAIVAVGAPGWFDGEAAEQAARAGTGVIGVVQDALQTEQLAALGAAVLPSEATVEQILDSCRSGDARPTITSVSAQPSRPRGKLIAVWGPKGSPGRTTVAVELAFELAAVEPETLLVDGDPYGGDMIQLLGIEDELSTLIWATRLAAQQSLDPGRLATELRRGGEDGPILLPGLPRADLWKDVSDYGWRQLLTVAKALHAYTVVDTGFCLEAEASLRPDDGTGRNRMSRAALAAADHVVAVCRSDPLGLKHFLWNFEELLTLTEADNTLIVANRTRPQDEREVSDLLRRHVGKRPVAYVPDKPDDLRRALAVGRPLRHVAPGSDFQTAMRSLAAALGGAVRPAGLLARLAGRASP